MVLLLFFFTSQNEWNVVIPELCWQNKNETAFFLKKINVFFSFFKFYKGLDINNSSINDVARWSSLLKTDKMSSMSYGWSFQLI